MSNFKPSLVRKRDEVATDLKSQIAKGRVLDNTEVDDEEEMDNLDRKESDWSGFNAELLARSFDNESLAHEYRNLKVNYKPRSYIDDRIDAFTDRIQKRIAFLKKVHDTLKLIPELTESSRQGNHHQPLPRSPESQTSTNPIDIVEHICYGFPRLVKRLDHRHENRPPFVINDEYDVQDLTHGLLTIFFDDIRPEEWTPSYAGGSARMDLLLKKESIVVEMKNAGPRLGAKEIGDQLLVDIARYAKNHDCKILVCMIYDPLGHVRNPRGLENDLSGRKDGLTVKVIVTPSWR